MHGALIEFADFGGGRHVSFRRRARTPRRIASTGRITRVDALTPVSSPIFAGVDDPYLYRWAILFSTLGQVELGGPRAPVRPQNSTIETVCVMTAESYRATAPSVNSRRRRVGGWKKKPIKLCVDS